MSCSVRGSSSSSRTIVLRQQQRHQLSSSLMPLNTLNVILGVLEKTVKRKKVFYVGSGYHFVRSELRRKGWVETKSCRILYTSKQQQQQQQLLQQQQQQQQGGHHALGTSVVQYNLTCLEQNYQALLRNGSSYNRLVQANVRESKKCQNVIFCFKMSESDCNIRMRYLTM